MGKQLGFIIKWPDKESQPYIKQGCEGGGRERESNKMFPLSLWGCDTGIVITPGAAIAQGIGQ